MPGKTKVEPAITPPRKAAVTEPTPVAELVAEIREAVFTLGSIGGLSLADKNKLDAIRARIDEELVRLLK